MTRPRGLESASVVARFFGLASGRARRRDAGRGLPAATTEVDLSRVLAALCEHARAGYCEPYKREVIGILLGRVSRAGAIVCRLAVPYRTPFRWRTVCDPHPQALRRRALALAAAARLRWLGCYHSHPEEARSRAHALSPEDREIFLADPDARVEVVISVDRAGRTARVPATNPRRNRDGSLSYWREGFFFRISAGAKLPRVRRHRRGPRCGR